MSQYVCVRVTRMDGVDIGLFDYDRYNTLYFFLLNAEEQIYMRYGGRDSLSPKAYLDLESLELALEQGLEIHRRYLEGEWKSPERPEPLFPRQIPALLEETAGRCVECHLIGDLQNVQREREGKLDKLSDMFRAPDIKTLGIELDIPKGLVVKASSGTARAAGLSAGDRITRFNNVPVWTFGDLQYEYDKVDRGAREVRVTVARGAKPVKMTVSLPARWWWTDLTYRQLTVDPRAYFKSKPLTRGQKSKRGLDPMGFAGEVTAVDAVGQMLGLHGLLVGDVVFAVDGIERDEIANTPELFIQLRKQAGEALELGVIRDGVRMSMPAKTARMSYRK